MSFILAVNAGSSSLKISLYQRGPSELRVRLTLVSDISNISAPPATFVFDGQQFSTSEITDHASAFAKFLSHLDPNHRKGVRIVCHRVVHGGDINNRVVINEASYHHIASLSDLAPLHNGAALSVIKACIEQLPEAKSVAYFDTVFHRSIPLHIASYLIDQSVAKRKGLKKYGFHGLSYSFILRSVSRFLDKQPTSLNLIALHLGSGASVCAIQRGQSLDTSMELTPVSGLPGATRSGSIDPSVIFHYTSKAGKITHDPGMAIDLKVTQAEEILNRKSGWKALTGTTDFRTVAKGAASASSDTDPNRLAYNIFVDRILGFIGSYHLKLEGRVNAIVFAGGIGERSQQLREAICSKVTCLGYAKIDQVKNVNVGEGVVVDIGTDEKGSRDVGRILVCRTDEQEEMAKACAHDEEFW